MSKIFVTRPFLPKKEDFYQMIENIWASNTLTNNGQYHQELESRISDFLQVEHISLQANGTLALWSAIRALGCTGEIITTPFSFIATAHAICLNNCIPKFVDICQDGYNIDPNAIEAAITEKTSAILPVHCYGHPANVELIQKIAQKYNLKVIYDAAHAFGVSDAGGSVLRHGDMSALSFHATKVFSTVEGGAVVCKTREQKLALDQIKNFGITGETDSISVGINAKMSELHAAFGLLQLNTIDECLNERERVAKQYSLELADTTGIEYIRPEFGHRHNYSYFPILITKKSKVSRDEMYQELSKNDIYARRYFYPLITEQSSYKHFKCGEAYPNAKLTSERVLCLPIYPALKKDEVRKICNTIKGIMN